jgi:hypothetical protein
VGYACISPGDGALGVLVTRRGWWSRCCSVRVFYTDFVRKDLVGFQRRARAKQGTRGEGIASSSPHLPIPPLRDSPDCWLSV